MEMTGGAGVGRKSRADPPATIVRLSNTISKTRNLRFKP
jgi:hypothetical protein